MAVLLGVFGCFRMGGGLGNAFGTGLVMGLCSRMAMSDGRGIRLGMVSLGYLLGGMAAMVLGGVAARAQQWILGWI